jgi:hypothetical protein
MPGFLYFLPDLNDEPLLAKCRELGIGYALERPPIGRRVQNVFGKHGWIVADPDRVEPGHVKYEAALQVWQKWTPPGCAAAVWVGMYSASPPTVGSLQRRNFLGGQPVELADGGVWYVPVARQWHDDDGPGLIYSTDLPRTARLNDDGEWMLGDVTPALKWLWDLSVRFYDAKIGQATFNALRAAAQALSANYLVNEAELSLLGCVTREHAIAVLDALVQWPVAEELFQKKMLQRGSAATAGSDSASGPAAAEETTALPSST